jgi:hypothetical protein
MINFHLINKFTLKKIALDKQQFEILSGYLRIGPMHTPNICAVGTP